MRIDEITGVLNALTSIANKAKKPGQVSSDIGRIMSPRTGTSNAVGSKNTPSPSITNKIGAGSPPKTGTNVLKKAANTGFQSAIKSTATSMGADDNSNDSPTTDTTPGTTGTTGTQSAQDMQNSPEATLDVINGEEVPEITLPDMKVNIQPGSKNIELVSKDKKTKIELPQKDLLARMQELAGNKP
jgi:hypothetical protein|tara:strand:- start:481 stop:1038 length:558 start_codon:yes stop_codon:yes gene_type:complete